MHVLLIEFHADDGGGGDFPIAHFYESAADLNAPQARTVRLFDRGGHVVDGVGAQKRRHFLAWLEFGVVILAFNDDA